MSEKHPDDEKRTGGERDEERFKLDDEELGLPEDLLDELKRLEKKEPPPEEDKESKRRNLMQMVVASQFAYTLVAATLLMGWAGNWIGNKLGGQPWTWILMFVFGGFGFAAEMYRMLKMFSPTDKSAGKSDKKNDDRDEQKKS